jgi:pimeloyl-ACP methyl ester carboxylesterase
MEFIGLDAWRQGGGTFEWRGHRIFTRAEGQGDALLLIHGFPTASWDWHKLWAPLAARFRVLTLDMLGFGLSAKPRRFAYCIASQADLFEDFLAAQGVTRYHLLAHDYGDTVAQELLARQVEGRARQRMGSLCLLNGGLFPEAHRPLLIQRLLASPLGPLLAPLSGKRRLAASLARICAVAPTPAELGVFWELISASGGLAVMPKLLGYLAERRRHRERWVGALQQATVPLRLINGLVDPISGAHLAARYRELVAHPDVVGLEGVGHYPQMEAPEQVLRAVLAFLSTE